MHRIGIDLKATLPQTLLALSVSVGLYRFIIRREEPWRKPLAQTSVVEVPFPAATVAEPPKSESRVAASDAQIRSLHSAEDLDRIGRGKSVLLVCKGHSAADAESAKQAFDRAIKNIGWRGDELTYYVVDDASAYIPATTLLTRLGISHDKPFVIILDRFIATEHKYLSQVTDVPTSSQIEEFLLSFLSGQLQPARLGQPRPAGDRSASCAHVTEVVTDSFHELVLDPHKDVLVECYTRRCDACKAFAPRYRLFATLCAQVYGGEKLRVAAMDILDNDREVQYLPEKWTPSLRFFPAAPSPGSSKPPSILYQHTSAHAGVEGSAGGTGGGGTEATSATGTKVYLPTIPELLQFIHESSGGRLPLTPGILSLAHAAEERAAALESAYAVTLRYMKLWDSYNSLVEESRAQAVEAGESSDSPRMTELATAQQVSDRLRSRIIGAYKYIVDTAGGEQGEEEGGVAQALARLDEVAEHVRQHGVDQVVMEAMRRAESGAEGQQADPKSP